MSRRAWLTPDDAPGAAVCRPVFIPSSLPLEAAFRGAFLLLCDPENWEQHGEQTPEDIAGAFQDAFYQTVAKWEDGCVDHLVGEVFLFAGDTAPLGALACDGATILIDDYPALYAVIGVTFGGDGIDDFTLPDLRGRLPVGTGQGSGLTNRALGDQGGSEAEVLSMSQLPNIGHHHDIETRLGAVASGVDFSAWIWEGPVTVSRQTTTALATSPNGQSHNNVPPFLALNYFIQAE